MPAPDWSPSNKEAGRVDDLLRAGRRLYVAGNFTEFANHAGRVVRRTYLASVRASTGKLGRFAPRINGRVYALAKARGLLFIGGSFSAVNGHARHNLAAFNLRTGHLSRRMRDLRIRGTVNVARGDPSGGLRRRLVLVGRRPAAGEAGQAHRPRRPLPGGARGGSRGRTPRCARSWSSRRGGSSPAATSRP